MKAFLEIEYSRGNWNHKFNFVRAQEVLSPEGELLFKTVNAMVDSLKAATAPVAPVVEAEVLNLSPEPEAPAAPAIPTEAELAAAAADPFAAPASPLETVAETSEVNSPEDSNGTPATTPAEVTEIADDKLDEVIVQNPVTEEAVKPAKKGGKK